MLYKDDRIIPMHFLKHVIPLLATLGVWTYWLAFGASLAESLAFIGILIPGTAIVILAGFSAAHGIIHPMTLMWLVALGAVLGDSLSYYLGTKGTKLFHDDNRLLKTSHLERSKLFFAKHGNKSIFLARFIGPLRPFVPFLAGVSKMKISVFFFWNILSAILWSTAFVLIGYFFGHAFRAIEIWITRASILIVLIIILGFGVWYGASRVKPALNFLNRWF